MRRILLAAALAGFSLSPASAADLPIRPVSETPAATSSWAGWYIGGHAGYGWARSQEALDPPFFGGFYVDDQCTIIPKDCAHDLRGFIGGGHAGFNIQNGNFVFGIEASFSGAGVSGTETIDLGSGPNSFATKIKSLLLTTGRFGYAWDRTLLYAKAGYAGGSVRFTATGVPGTETGTSAVWHNGWTVGTGVEYALTPNWIAGVEYLFADLGSYRRLVTGSLGSVAPITVDVDKVQSVLARVSYRFGSR